MSNQHQDKAYRLVAQAQTLLDKKGDEHLAVAALCFEALAICPTLTKAAELVLAAYRDPSLIRASRRAVGRHVEEWDDRSWQRRRRLALSFRFTSDLNQTLVDPPKSPIDKRLPSAVCLLLEEGRNQLLQDYLLGQSRGSELAWALFQEAVKRTANAATVTLWLGHHFAMHGYFAEAVELLEQLPAQFPGSKNGRLLWAKARWWRDNQARIPWIPPQTNPDGRLYRLMMAQVDPKFALEHQTEAQPFEHIPPDMARLPADIALPAPVPLELIQGVEAALSGLADEKGGDTAVDWSYLDQLESGDIDTGQFPEWAQYLLLEIDDPQQERFLKNYLLSYLANPPSDDPDEASE